MKAIGKALLIISVFEVSVGGGGRLLDTGPISPRMVLFGLGLLYSIAMLLRQDEMPRDFIWLTGLFVALSCLSALRSIAEGQSLMAALADFKPLAYFFLLPFFAITIRTVSDVVIVSTVIKISAVMLAASYFLAMFAWKSGLLTTDQMIGWLNPHHDPRLEFYFRGDTTFYFKAILYVGVGAFFFVTGNSRISSVVAVLLILTIGLSRTRGVWLAVFLILAVWIFFFSATRLRGAILSTVVLAVGLLGVVWMSLTLPSAALSNSIRANDVRQLLIRLSDVRPLIQGDWRVLLGGNGFGTPIFGRQAIELTYVNILFKQGIAGLFFWLLPIAYVAWGIRRTTESRSRLLAMPYLMATAFVYLVSATNPFLTNPIGMSVVMIAMVVVKVIREASGAMAAQPALRHARDV